ncbi:MAG: hypothetical protein F4018_07625 [Acidobacteria bacterium]|nr:hypothetical protein [Acidobacteriota bacterium]MYH29308.1 hypothetical protein [Acidobacteriota bacterium]MYK88213.1 hypothetical protein [Acidobacteriota bacterium]
MEATIVHVGGNSTGLVRATYEADDEHTLARRIDAAIDQAKTEGREVRIEITNDVMLLMEKHGYAIVRTT